MHACRMHVHILNYSILYDIQYNIQYNIHYPYTVYTTDNSSNYSRTVHGGPVRTIPIAHGDSGGDVI